MEILDAYDLSGSLRDAAELAGCSHHTVKRYVEAPENGRNDIHERRQQVKCLDQYPARGREGCVTSRLRSSQVRRSQRLGPRTSGCSHGGDRRVSRRCPQRLATVASLVSFGSCT